MSATVSSIFQLKSLQRLSPTLCKPMKIYRKMLFQFRSVSGKVFGLDAESRDCVKRSSVLDSSAHASSDDKRG